MTSKQRQDRDARADAARLIATPARTITNTIPTARIVSRRAAAASSKAIMPSLPSRRLSDYRRPALADQPGRWPRTRAAARRCAQSCCAPGSVRGLCRRWLLPMKPISLVSPAAGSTLSSLLAAPATENGTPAGGGDGAKGRASPPSQPSSDAPSGAAAIGSDKQIVEPVFGQITACQGLPTVPSAWLRTRQSRMGAHLHRPQPAQARQGHSVKTCVLARATTKSSSRTGNSLLLSQAPRI